MPVKSVKPRGTSPRRWTRKRAITPPTAASRNRKNADAGSACTAPCPLRPSLGLPHLLRFVRSRVVVVQAKGRAELGRRRLVHDGVSVGRCAQPMALADRDVVTDVRLHADVVQVTVVALELKNPLA